MHSSPSVNVLKSQKLCVCKKYIYHYDVLISKRCFQLKYKSIIHDTAFSKKKLKKNKVIWSESGEKSAQIKHPLQSKTALNKYVAGFLCERRQEMDIFTGGSIIMNYGLLFCPEAIIWSKTCLNDGFVSYKHSAFVFSRC